MKAIGYYRVSDFHTQALTGCSLQAQREKIQAYATLHDITLVDIIADEGRSAKTLLRPGMQELLGRVKAHEIDCIIVTKLDRLSRSVRDTIDLIELFRKHKVQFHSIGDHVDTSNSLGRFFLHVISSLAELERGLISERTAECLRAKLARNERAGEIRYGWQLSDDGHTLEENPTEQRIISIVRELHNKGFSYRKICTELTANGYTPKGEKWHAKTIGSILKRAA